MPSAGLDSVLKRGRPARLDPRILVRTEKKTRGYKTPRKLPSQTVGGRCLRELNESGRAELGETAKPVAKIESGTVAFARETCSEAN